jgi:hypothetical protein
MSVMAIATDLWCSSECTPPCQGGGRGFKSRQVRHRAPTRLRAVGATGDPPPRGASGERSVAGSEVSCTPRVLQDSVRDPNSPLEISAIHSSVVRIGFATQRAPLAADCSPLQVHVPAGQQQLTTCGFLCRPTGLALVLHDGRGRRVREREFQPLLHQALAGK